MCRNFEIFKEKVENLNLKLPQPNAYTCQSACIGMAVGDDDIMSIWNKLNNIGTPGDPYVMGEVIRSYNVNYEFDDNACLDEVRSWLKAGEFLITHGWFTNSGHVICLDGLELDTETLSYRFDVKDPWSEFDAPSWSYNNPQVKFFDGYYSSYCIYAACVAGASRDHASGLYAQRQLNSQRRGMWVHRFKP